MNKQIMITLDSDIADLPPDLAELCGILEGIEAPDKKELRRMFHEKDNHCHKSDYFSKQYKTY